MDPRLSALDKLGDLHLTIKGVFEQEQEEPHIDPDVLLALCHHIKTRDFSNVEVQGLLAQPNQTGFPCLSQKDTVHILAAYYEAKQAHRDKRRWGTWKCLIALGRSQRGGLRCLSRQRPSTCEQLEVWAAGLSGLGHQGTGRGYRL